MELPVQIGEVVEGRYKILRPLLPLMHAIAPGAVITTEELGRAMIRAARQGAPKRVLENRDLRALAVVQIASTAARA